MIGPDVSTQNTYLHTVGPTAELAIPYRVEHGLYSQCGNMFIIHIIVARYKHIAYSSKSKSKTSLLATLPSWIHKYNTQSIK